MWLRRRYRSGAGLWGEFAGISDAAEWSVLGGGSTVMANYRLFVLDGRPPNQMLDIRACDDLEAIELAQKHRGRHPIELWSMGRRIKRFDTLPADAGMRAR